MKLFKLALCYLLLSPLSSSFAEQLSDEVWGNLVPAMEGARSLPSSSENPLFINPALLALDSLKFDDSALSLPTVGASASYDAHGDFSVVAVNESVQMNVFYNTYADAIGVNAIDIEAFESSEALKVQEAELMDLDSKGILVAGAVSDFGVALSFPLSIVNMPISVGVSPKLQKIDTYNYEAVINSFEPRELDDASYRSDETTFNLDIGVAMEPVEGLVVAMSGRDLISKELEAVESQGKTLSYRVDPKFAAGVAYDWNRLTFTTDIDLNPIKRFDETVGTQYWRFKGEVRATDWLALRLGYRHDMKDNRASVYSLGTGVELGQVFSLDFTGMVSSDDAIGGVLKTSYHF
ncbi:conjugal transfer protein TraF [Shewanella sediminis]|nr:conjugal transfer protein TraF [Shewanella sediminis]